MTLRKRVWTVLLALGLMTTFTSAPARAADLDPYLPPDTEVLVTFNFKQLVNSPLIKKVGLDTIRQALNQDEEVAGLLKALSFDPLKDVDRLTMAQPATGDQDKGLIIVRGRFDLPKFKAQAEKLAKDKKDQFKIMTQKLGQDTITYYEVKVDAMGNEVPLYAAFASKNVLLAAPGKDYLFDALKVAPGVKPTLKSKAFQDLVAKIDDEQTMSVVMIGEALKKGLQDLPLDKEIKDVIDSLTAFAGGITVTDGVKLEFSAGAKDAASAKGLGDMINKGVSTALATLLLLANQQKELAPLVDALKTVKVTAKDKTVSIKGEIGKDVFDKLMPKDN